jgi:hypothetical protein
LTPDVLYHDSRWNNTTTMHKHPITRPMNDSFQLVGGLDVASLEYDIVPEKLLFFRQEACELWDVLDALQLCRRKIGLDVEGSPGMGKSTEVWSWISNRFALNPTSGIFAIWIQLLLKLPARVVVFDKGGGIYWKEMLDSEIDAFLKLDLGHDVRFIILDGFCSDDVHSKIRALAYWKRSQMANCQVITVMSMGIKRNPACDDMLNIDVVLVNPWTLEQYQAACRNNDFLKAVSLNFPVGDGLNVADNIQKRYYYAGGSARWMFSVSHKRLMEMISRHVSQVPNVEQLLLGNTGENNSVSSNHLMASYKIGLEFSSCIISKHVASVLLSKSESSVYKIAYNLASQQNNPAFLGWIVEFDFISQMRQCCAQRKQFEFVNDGFQGVSVRWDVPALLDFDPDCYDKSQMPVESWLKPVKWNQEAYVLIGLFFDQGQHYLRFVQITNANDHTANLQVFQKSVEMAKNKLGIDFGVEIIVVSPLFRVQDPTNIILRNERSLSKVKIGSTTRFWTGETARSCIKFLYFNQQK